MCFGSRFISENKVLSIADKILIKEYIQSPNKTPCKKYSLNVILNRCTNYGVTRSLPNWYIFFINEELKDSDYDYRLKEICKKKILKDKLKNPPRTLISKILYFLKFN